MSVNVHVYVYRYLVQAGRYDTALARAPEWLIEWLRVQRVALHPMLRPAGSPGALR